MLFWGESSEKRTLLLSARQQSERADRTEQERKGFPMETKFKQGQTVYVPYDHEIIECKVIAVKQKPSFWTGKLLPLYEVSGIFPLGDRILTDNEHEYLKMFVENDLNICFQNGRFASKVRGEWEENVFDNRPEAEKALFERDRKKQYTEETA